MDEAIFPLLIDSHNHIIEDEKCNELISSVHIAKLHAMSCSENDFQKTQNLYLDHPARIVAYFGVHPWKVESSNLSDAILKMQDMLKKYPSSHDLEKLVGEIGIDKRATVKGNDSKLTKKKIDIDVQWDFFRKQWNLAAEYQRNVSIHCVKAYGSLCDFFAEAYNLNTVPSKIMLHSFSGSKESAVAILNLPKGIREKIFFSFSKIVNDKTKGFSDMIKVIPMNRILVESDLDRVEDVEQAVYEIVLLLSKVFDLEVLKMAQVLRENALYFETV